MKRLKPIRLSNRMRTNLTGYCFLLPNIIGVFCFTIIPIVYSLIVSFTDWNFTRGFGNWKFIGLQNYIEMWSDKWFVDSLRNTVIFGLVVVTLTVSLSLVLSVIIDRFCFGRLPIRLAAFMPYISNVVAISIVWVMMFSPWGPFTQMVKLLGVKNPPQWLADYDWSLPAVILVTIWMNIGYCIMIYTSAIQGLPVDIYEAADMDGAGEITKFFRITVRLLSPTTFFLFVTTLISSFQVFAPIQLMTAGGPGTSSSVLVYYIYKSAFSYYDMGYASAMSWILFLLLFLVTIIQWMNQKRLVDY